MQEGTSSERVPSVVMITVRWGASILMAKRISPPRTMVLAGGVGKLELGPQGLDLVAGRERLRVVPGKRLKTIVDDVEIVIDATEDKLALAVPLAAPFERKYAAADVGSFLLHVGALAFCFLWRTPLSHAETEVAPLKETLDEAHEQPVLLPLAQMNEGQGATAAPLERGVTQPTRVAAPRPVGAAPLRALDLAPASNDPMRDAQTFGMAGLLAADERLEAASPWADDVRTTASFGGNDALGDLLSGVGEGAGGKGEGYGVATLGRCGDDCLATVGNAVERPGGIGAWSTSIGYMRPDRRAKAPTVRMGPNHGVSGRLPAGAIQRIVRQNFGRFRLCYEKALETRPELEARVSVSFVIARDGSVASVSGSGDGAPAPMVSCVTKAFYGLSFPAPEDGVVAVTYPIVFSTDG